MKVLIISHSSVLEFHQQKLEIMASEYGHTITLVTPPRWKEGGVIVRAYTGSSNLQYRIGKVLASQRTLLHVYLDAARIIGSTCPDIVHIEEEPHNPACWQFVKAARRHRKTTILFSWENIPRRQNPVLTLFERYSIRNVDGAIAGNDDAKRLLLQKGCRGPIEVIPQYGINLEEFAAARGEACTDRPSIAYVGRIIPEKGIETLLNALHRNRDLNLVLAGTGSDAYVRILKTRIGELGLESRVRFAGFINRKQMPRFLSTIDILVLPSLTTKVWKEQFGRVIIEAFASGVPVVGSNSGEIPHIIGSAGVIFEEGNSGQLADALARLTHDKELRRRCKEEGTHRVRLLYTNAVLAERINAMYVALKGA